MANPFKKRYVKKKVIKKSRPDSVVSQFANKIPKRDKSIKKRPSNVHKGVKRVVKTTRRTALGALLLNPVGIGILVVGFLIAIVFSLFLFVTISNSTVNNASALIAVLSDDKYRAELKANGTLGDEDITWLDGIDKDNSNSDSKSDDKKSDSNSDVKGTNVDHFMLSAVKGYGNDVAINKINTKFGGKGQGVADAAKKSDINLMAFLVISQIEGGGAGNYINHFASNTSSDPVQMAQDDFVIFAGKKGDKTANGGTLAGSAFDDDDTAFNYSTQQGFFKKSGIHDTAFTDNWSSVASKDNMKKNAPKGSVGRYGLYQTAAIAYPAMTGKPMPKEPGYPQGGPDWNSKANIQPIIDKYKK